MTATFNPLLATALDRIRRAVGDTDVEPDTNALRTDEEIVAVVDRTADERLAIIEIASGLAVQYAQLPDSISDEGTTISWRERVKTWLAIADTLRKTLAAEAAADALAAGAAGYERLERFESDEAEYDYHRVEATW